MSHESIHFTAAYSNSLFLCVPLDSEESTAFPQMEGLILDSGFRGKVCNGWDGMTAGKGSGKLSGHIFKHKQKTQSNLEAEQGYDVSKPAPGEVFLH